MKRFTLVLSCLLFLGAFAYAQTDSSASETSKNKSTTIQGCLSGTNGDYMLTDSSGKTYPLSGKVSGLENSVGHEIQISGIDRTEIARTATGTPNSQNDRLGHRTDAAESRFSVSSFKDVSPTCK